MAEIEERKEYSKKLDSQIKGIDELIALPSSIITPSIIEELKKIRNKAVKCKRKIDTGEFEIAIVGLEKAGKSSFANALIENETLPVAAERCTYTSSSIRYGVKDHAVVKFFEVNEFYDDFTDKLEKVGIPNAKAMSLKTLTTEEYKKKFEEFGKKDYESSLNKEIESIIDNKDSITFWLGKGEKSYDDLENQELKNFISSVTVSFAAKQIDIQTNKLENLENAIIYDVPGFNSPTLFMKEQTKKYMKEADAVLFIAKADEPTIEGTVGRLFMEYTKESDADGVTLAEKLFPFANKADKINIVADKSLKDLIEEHRNALFKGLGEYCKFTKKDRIIYGSAQGFLDERKGTDLNGTCEKLTKAGVPYGISEIKEKLAEYNKNERFPILKNRINRIQTEIENLFSDILESNKDIESRNVSMEERFDIQEDLLDDSKKIIITKLNELWRDIKEDLKTNPLSNALTSKLGVWLSGNNDNSTIENYSNYEISKFEVTDEELKKVAIECNDDLGGKDFKKMDVTLRERRNTEIKNDFNKLVLDLAISEHNKYDDRIKKIFTEGLSITESNPFYKEIDENIDKYLKDIKRNIEYNGYYKSLIDRFSINIIELLIGRPFDLERKTQYFDIQKNNFYVLASVDDGMDSTCSIDEQPLFSLILKHEDKYIRESTWKPVFDTMSKYVSKVPEELVKPLIKQFIPFGNVPIVQDIVEKCFQRLLTNKEADTDDKKIAKLQERLEYDTADNDKDASSDAFENFYNKYKIKEDTEIQQIINDDIKILNYVLIHVVVKAISLETPFNTLENDFIQNIKQDINKSNRESLFKKFVKFNLNKIAHDKLKDITRKEEEMKRISDAVRIIKEILSNIKSNTWEE